MPYTWRPIMHAFVNADFIVWRQTSLSHIHSSLALRLDKNILIVFPQLSYLLSSVLPIVEELLACLSLSFKNTSARQRICAVCLHAIFYAHDGKDAPIQDLGVHVHWVTLIWWRNHRQKLRHAVNVNALVSMMRSNVAIDARNTSSPRHASLDRQGRPIVTIFFKKTTNHLLIYYYMIVIIIIML